MESKQDGPNTKIIGLCILAIIIISTAVVVVFNRKNEEISSTTLATKTAVESSEETAEQPIVADQTAEPNQYKNGTYSATGSYTSPGGNEEIKVTVTLNNDTVTGVDVEPQDATPTSSEYQEEFESAYKSKVVGKDIDSLNLSRVAGSSLTSRGFNDAIDQIQQQAKA